MLLHHHQHQAQITIDGPGNFFKGEIIDINSGGMLVVKIDGKKLEFKNQEIELIY